VAKMEQQLPIMLTSARKKLGISQEALGKRMRRKRSQTWVARFERGARQLTVPEFVEVAAIMGNDPVQMLRAALGK